MRDTKVKDGKDHGKNYIKVRPLLSAIFSVMVYYYVIFENS